MKLLRPSRRLFLAQALAAPALITSPRLVEAFWQSRDSNYNKAIQSASSGSGWGDHGTQITLSTTSIANDTLTANSTTSFSTTRGTQFHTTGKFYYEVKLLTAPGANALFIGLVDAHEANGAPLDSQNIQDGVHSYFNDGTTLVNDSTSGLAGVNISGAGVTITNGDILAVAYDATNGFHYLAQNNTYFLGGDPTSGGSGTGHVGAYTGAGLGLNMYPSVSIWGLVNAVVQLVTGAGALTYAPPSGYSAWG